MLTFSILLRQRLMWVCLSMGICPEFLVKCWQCETPENIRSDIKLRKSLVLLLKISVCPSFSLCFVCFLFVCLHVFIQNWISLLRTNKKVALRNHWGKEKLKKLEVYAGQFLPYSSTLNKVFRWLFSF